MARAYKKRRNSTVPLDHLIREIILDTGYSETVVRKTVESFLATLQETSIHAPVLLPSFGLFETKLSKRNLWSFKEQKNVPTLVPLIKVTASKGYNRMIVNGKDPVIR